MSKTTRQQKRHLTRSVKKRAVRMRGFKIPIPPELSLAGAEQPDLQRLDEMVRSISGRQKAEAITDRDDAMGKTLAAIATNAWRTKMKMVDESTGEPKEEMKRAYRHIEGILDALKDASVEIIDPVGRAYDMGMALKVIAFEQTSGISRKQIKETIRPSVIWRGRLLQMGEVVVGTPENSKQVLREDNHE